VKRFGKYGRFLFVINTPKETSSSLPPAYSFLLLIPPILPPSSSSSSLSACIYIVFFRIEKNHPGIVLC
jgi:hypothetical protein